MTPEDQAALAAQMALINQLRADEGDAVEVFCDNPEGPPNNAIHCSGAWTDWKDRRFSGETLLACLKAAVAARAGA